VVYSTPSEITQPAAVDQAAANAHAWVPGSPWRLRYRKYWDDPWLYLNSGCDLQFWSGYGFNPLRDSSASGGGNLATPQGPTAKSRKEDWTVAEGTAAGSPQVLVRMFIYHYNSLHMFIIYIYIYNYIYMYGYAYCTMIYRILCAGCWFVKQGMCTQVSTFSALVGSDRHCRRMGVNLNSYSQVIAWGSLDSF